MKLSMQRTIVRGLVCSILALLALSFTALPGAAAPRAVSADFAAIDRYIEQELQATRLPGLALGIVQGDQIVHLKGFGVADPSGRPVTPQTPFLIASTSKSFTAPCCSPSPRQSPKPSSCRMLRSPSIRMGCVSSPRRWARRSPTHCIYH